MVAQGYEAQLVCGLLELARSSYYRQPAPKPDEPVKTALLQAAGAWPTYGYRRLTAQLKRDYQTVNSKRVRRLMTELGLKRAKPRRKVGTTNSRHGFARFPNLVAGLVINQPDQAWVADITYIQLKTEFVYLAVIMDVYTRQIRGWELGRSLDQPLTLAALERALAEHRPVIHHSDQGGQYAAPAYVHRLKQLGAQISMAAVGQPEENGYAERLMRTIKEEEVDLSEYHDFTDAYQQIGRFLDDVYNGRRIHSALGYLTPSEFAGRWVPRAFGARCPQRPPDLS
jgi:transposase InsO family protein